MDRPVHDPSSVNSDDATLLAQYAVKLNTRDDLWIFPREHETIPRSPGHTLMIIRACLALGVPVTDTISSEAWSRMVTMLVTLENRVRDLEHLIAVHDHPEGTD